MMRKQRNDKGKPRGSMPRRADARASSVMVPRILRAHMARAWPGRPSDAIATALRSVYGARVPDTLDTGLRDAVASADSVKVSIQAPEAWRELCARERVTLSALVSHALFVVYILGA